MYAEELRAGRPRESGQRVNAAEAEAADSRTKKALLIQIIDRVDRSRDGFALALAVSPALAGATAETSLVWSKAAGCRRLTHGRGLIDAWLEVKETLS